MRSAVVCPLLAALVSALNACGEPPPKTARKEESVPANSLSDARLQCGSASAESSCSFVDSVQRGWTPSTSVHPDDRKSTETSRSSTETDSNPDPTKPYTTRVGEALPPDPGAGGGTDASKPAVAGSKDAARGKGVVSKAECDRVMDKYLDLEIAKNPQLKDVPPELIEQAKEAARQQHGDTPCTATRAQYTCAMAATSTAAWQRCMK